jgi:23S rRNA-/tRNA-specific pseudouridylate synthase
LQRLEGLREVVKGCVLYKDDDLLILNKPPGLAIQGGCMPRNVAASAVADCKLTDVPNRREQTTQ